VTAAAAPTLTAKQHEALAILAAADPDGLRVSNVTEPGVSLYWQSARALTDLGLADIRVAWGGGEEITATDEGNALARGLLDDLNEHETSDPAGGAPDTPPSPPAPPPTPPEPTPDDACPDPDCRGTLDGDGHCDHHHEDQPPDPADYGVGPVENVAPCADCGEVVAANGRCTSCDACLDCGGQVFDDDGMCVPCQAADQPTDQQAEPRFPPAPMGGTVTRGSATIKGRIADLDHGPPTDQDRVYVLAARPTGLTYNVADGAWRYTLDAHEDVYELSADAIAAWCRDEDLPDLTPEAILRAAQRHAIDQADRRDGRARLPLDQPRGGEPAHVSEALAEIADGLNRDELEARDEDGIRDFDDERRAPMLVGVLNPPEADGDQWELVTDNARMAVGLTREHAEQQARAWFGEAIELADEDGAVMVSVVDQDDLLAAAHAHTGSSQ